MNTFNLFVSEEYGYQEYLLTIEGITIEQLIQFAATVKVEDFFFSSYAFFDKLKKHFGCQIKDRDVEHGEHPLFGQWRFTLKEEHQEEEAALETHPEFFAPVKYDGYTHMHEKEDSYIKVGERTFHFG